MSKGLTFILDKKQSRSDMENMDTVYLFVA